MTTVALNIIVGPKEARLLRRCLDSFDAKNNFDEIVIVNTSLDDEVNKVALQYTDKVFYYQWETEEHPYGDFGGARNCAMLNTESDKIWWLDTDDVCKDEHLDKLIESLKVIKEEQYKDVLIWLMPYTIIMNEDGSPDVWFKRERVFDRKLIKWKRTIHEILFPGVEMVKHATINNMHITHLPAKPSYSSALRNVKMLEWELNKTPNDTQTKYFLGRDYMFTGEIGKGVALLEDIISEMSTSYEMLYAIVIELAWFYSYGCLNPHPDLELFKKDNILKVESYCRLALTYTIDYAEPYVLLGDVYLMKNQPDNAIKMYQVAMRKTLGKGKFQTTPLYFEIPADRLSRVFEVKSILSMALYYNDLARKNNTVKDYYIHRKRYLANKLMEEVNNECKN